MQNFLKKKNKIKLKKVKKKVRKSCTVIENKNPEDFYGKKFEVSMKWIFFFCEKILRIFVFFIF